MPFLSFTIIDILSEMIGSMLYYSHNWRVNAIEENLKSVGAENFRTRMIFVNMAKNHFELLKLYRMSNKKLKEITEIDAFIQLEQYKKNTFVLTGHFGNWEVAPNYVSVAGMKACTIAEFKNVGEKMYRILELFRGRYGMIVYPLEDSSTILKLRDRYNEGYTPFLLIDRDITKTGIPVKAGSRILMIPKGPFFMAKKFGSRIVIGAFVRNNSKKYRFRIVLKDLGKTDSVETGAQKSINSLLEMIRMYPEQWFAFDLNWEK
ncbi:MAG: lysophospholipid acyltransferase family protein [bacterium]